MQEWYIQREAEQYGPNSWEQLVAMAAADQFALACYYDRRTGALEGLTPVEVRDGAIVAATRRFSDIVVRAVQVDELSAAFAIETGFRPGYDDWQFPNHGFYVEPRGHCAGQAISALWYFHERRTNNNARPLYGRYDNNGRYGTIIYEGRLAATNRFAGRFTADALRLVPEAMPGRWQLERME
jgi:hypothetical protein